MSISKAKLMYKDDSASAEYRKRAQKRAMLIDKYCWNESKHLDFDYDTVEEKRSATAFWTLWAGCASDSEEQGRSGWELI